MGPRSLIGLEKGFPRMMFLVPPAAHKALWTERERQGRLDAAGLTPAGGESRGYLARLREYKLSVPRPSSRARRLEDRCGGRDVHVVTWRASERWSSLPAGFRQGARYRPPGPAPWSLDLYKGGIKKDPASCRYMCTTAAPSLILCQGGCLRTVVITPGRQRAPDQAPRGQARLRRRGRR